MKKQTAKQRKRHARNRRRRQPVPRRPTQAAKPETRALLRALGENVFGIASKTYEHVGVCIHATQIASAVLADDYCVESRPWVCKLWAHNETYRRLLAENYPGATSPFFPPEIDEWEKQGAFIQICTPDDKAQSGDEEGRFPYHVVLECGGFLVDLTLQQFSTDDFEMANPTMRKNGNEYFKVEMPSGVRVLYKRVHGVEVPFIYNDRFVEAKAKVSEALRHQLRWDKQIGRPLVEVRA